jgi:hypothetical protein
MRKAFNFYRSYWNIAKELSDNDRLQFYDALIKKQFTNIETNLEGMVKFAYLSQKHSIDKQIKGYQDKTKDPMQGPWQGCTEGCSQDPYLQEKEEEKEQEQVKEKEKVKVEHWNSDIDIYGFSKHKQPKQ